MSESSCQCKLTFEPREPGRENMIVTTRGTQYLINKLLKGLSEDEMLGDKTPCWGCGSADATEKCSNCYTAWYCSIDCQRKDWPEHKLQCAKVDCPAKARERAETQWRTLLFTKCCQILWYNVNSVRCPHHNLMLTTCRMANGDVMFDMCTSEHLQAEIANFVMLQRKFPDRKFMAVNIGSEDSENQIVRDVVKYFNVGETYGGYATFRDEVRKKFGDGEIRMVLRPDQPKKPAIFWFASGAPCDCSKCVTYRQNGLKLLKSKNTAKKQQSEKEYSAAMAAVMHRK